MKQLFLKAALIALLSLVGLPAVAQKHEVSFSYGFWPSANVPDYDNLPVLESPWTDGSMASALVNNVKASGGFTIAYMHKFSQMVSAGLSYTHRSIKRDFGFLEGDPAGRIKSGSNIFMVNAKLEWLKARDFYLYSRAGVGLQFISKGYKHRLDGINRELYDLMRPQHQTNIAWQLSVVGAEWRFLDDALAIFGELGVGQQGALQVGAKTFF